MGKKTKQGRQNAGSEGDYQVGYGRPPKHSRFKPGRSGNPKGRQKQSRNLKSVLTQVLHEPMEIRQGSRLRFLPAIEVVVRNTLARASRGEMRAVASLIVMMKQSGYSAEPAEGRQDLLGGVDPQEILREYFGRAGAEKLSGPKFLSDGPSEGPGKPKKAKT